MKIIGPESLRQPTPGSSPAAKKPLESFDFGNALRNALIRPETTDGVQKSALLTEPRAVQTIGQGAIELVSLVDRTSRAIDLLENYSKALSDPRKTLRDIEPELAAFVGEARSLYEDYLETDQEDPRMKDVMEDLIRTAQLEDIRFHRGDYLDTK